MFFFISVPNQERDSHTQSPEQNGWRRKPLRYTVHKGEVSDLVGAGLQQLALQYPHAAARTAFVQGGSYGDEPRDGLLTLFACHWAVLEVLK